MRHWLAAGCLLVIGSGVLYGQSSAPGAGSTVTAPNPSINIDMAVPATPALNLQGQAPPAEEQAMLASSAPDYPVTPGDIYTVSYVSSLGTTSFPANVDSDCAVNLSIFGKMKARDLTFPELRQKIEQKVLAGYPNSSPQVTIRYAGSFQVFVKGEVASAAYVSAWGLSRLDQVLGGRLTRYASVRDIIVIAADGAKRQYDLFAFTRAGDVSQNPYVKPGDTVVVARSERTVTLQGEVMRPGTYQLRPGEELAALIEHYGEGYSRLADSDRIRISRQYGMKTESPVEAVYVEGGRLDQYELRDLDSVYVFPRADLMPVVYFEGAIGADQDNPGTRLEASNRVAYRLEEGEMLSTVARKMAPRFSPVSDLHGAYILRAGEAAPIPVNIENLLYARDFWRSDRMLLPYDQIIIPFRQLFVTVSGAVHTPGRYPYIPDRGWRYYVGLAGGIDREKNVNDKLRITDVLDRERPKDGPIMPEDTINAEYNGLLYQFNRAAPIITTLASITSLVLGILSLVAR